MNNGHIALIIFCGIFGGILVALLWKFFTSETVDDPSTYNPAEDDGDTPKFIVDASIRKLQNHEFLQDLNHIFQRKELYLGGAFITLLVLGLFYLAGTETIGNVFQFFSGELGAYVYIAIPILGLYVSLFLTILGLQQFRTYNLLRKPPEEGVPDDSQNSVHLQGHVSSPDGTQLRSPLHGKDCLAYEISINYPNPRGPETALYKRESLPLLLDVESGKVMVDLEGSQWLLQTDIENRPLSNHVNERTADFIKNLSVDEPYSVNCHIIEPGQELRVFGEIGRGNDGSKQSVEADIPKLCRNAKVGKLYMTDQSPTQLANKKWYEAAKFLLGGVIIFCASIWLLNGILKLV